MDAEMGRRNLNAIVVFGNTTTGNPELYYVAGAHLPRGGIYVKKIGEKPVLVVSSIDIGNAEKGRVRRIQSYSDYGYEKILQKSKPGKATLMFYRKILRDNGVSGHVAIYGRNEVCSFLKLARELQKLGYKVVAEDSPNLLDALRETKDQGELTRIREVGDKTQKVLAETLNLLRSSRTVGGKLHLGGSKLTVGLVKAFIRRLFAEENLFWDSSGIIVAVGSRSADPHYPGEDKDPVLAGKPLVFDLSPHGEAYHFDVTRTHTVGKPLLKIRRMHEVVHETQLLVLDRMREDVVCGELMELACRNIERHGYKTMRSMFRKEKSLKSGFIHSLGHGVGLTIGEMPYLGLLNKEKLKRNSVVTVEPGLYELGLGGVRLEDAVVIRGGGVENLCSLGKNLEL